MASSTESMNNQSSNKVALVIGTKSLGAGLGMVISANIVRGQINRPNRTKSQGRQRHLRFTEMSGIEEYP